MKNRLKYSSLLSLSLLVLFFSSCSEWTDAESLTIEKPTLDKQNPELYARYIANLKEYKKSEHKGLYVWFNNSLKETFSRANHITSLPDSVDVIALTSPGNLTTEEVNDIVKVREKGTQVTYLISFREIEALHKDLPAPAPDAEPNPEFIPFMEKYMDNALSLCSQYGYDGVSVWYDGRSLGNMTAAELQTYTDRQASLFGKVTKWLDANKSKIFVFEGSPQYMVDKTILERCKYIVLRTQSEKSESALNFAVQEAMVAGVPADRFIVATQTYSMDATDKATGYFTNGGCAIIEGAYCVINSVNGQYIKAGLGIMNVHHDYYHPSLVYKTTKAAITIMNPANN